MYVGPNHDLVQEFNESLRYLTEEAWKAEVTTLLRSTPGLSQALDEANEEIFAASDEQELAAARAGTRDALQSLAWAPNDPSVADAAYLAVGALVVLDRAPKEKLAVAFAPFRRTYVNLPE